jgi:hypothetical protein
LHVTGFVPGAEPSPPHSWQATAVRTVTGAVTPKTAPSKLTSTTTSRSWPRGGPLGPRWPPPNGLPLKNASKMSPMPLPKNESPVADAPTPASPKRS